MTIENVKYGDDDGSGEEEAEAEESGTDQEIFTVINVDTNSKDVRC